jgi:hypothetical protein
MKKDQKLLVYMLGLLGLIVFIESRFSQVEHLTTGTCGDGQCFCYYPGTDIGACSTKAECDKLGGSPLCDTSINSIPTFTKPCSIDCAAQCTDGVVCIKKPDAVCTNNKNCFADCCMVVEGSESNLTRNVLIGIAIFLGVVLLGIFLFKKKDVIKTKVSALSKKLTNRRNQPPSSYSNEQMVKRSAREHL